MSERRAADPAFQILQDVDDDGWSSFCRRASAWLVERSDAFVQEISEEMAVAVPSYRERARTDSGRAELEVNVRAIVDHFHTLLAERRRLGADERALIEGIGAQRAEQGFELGSIQEAVHVAIRCGRRQLFDAVRVLATPADLVDALLLIDELFADFHYDVRGAFEAGFRRCQEEMRTDRLRGREAFLRRLLEGGANGRSVEVDASRVGIPGGPVVLLTAFQPRDTSSSEFEAGVAAFTRSLPALTEGPLFFTAPHAHAVAFAWGSGAPSELTDAAGVAEDLGLCVVASDPTSLTDLNATYRSLRDLSEVAVRHSGTGIHPGRRFRHLRLVTAGPDAEQVEFVHDTLGPAVTDRRYARQRLEQLRAFYESPDGKVKRAALLTGRAETTIRKTLDRIGELTGYHPIGDRFVVELALRLYDHHAEHLPEPGNPWWSTGR